MDFRMVINLIHILVVVPLFVYIGYRKSNSSYNLVSIMVGLSILVILYHVWKYWKTGWWINYIHIFIGGFLLIFSLLTYKLPNFAFNLYYILAFIILIVHGYLFMNRCCSASIENFLQPPISQY